MKTVVRFKTEGVLYVDPTDPKSVIAAFEKVDHIKTVIEESGMQRIEVGTKVSTIREKDDGSAEDVDTEGDD